MPDSENTFRPRKKRVAVYFNNGEYTFSMWASTDGTKGPGRQKLITAVNAAREAFSAAYLAKAGHAVEDRR